MLYLAIDQHRKQSTVNVRDEAMRARFYLTATYSRAAALTCDDASFSCPTSRRSSPPWTRCGKSS